MSLIKLKPNLQHTLNFANIFDWEMVRLKKWLLLLNINITILKSKLMQLIAWINLNLPVFCNISKPQKFNRDYNYHRALLTDNHRKHILILLITYSQNFRKLQEWFSEFEWDENRPQKRKSIRLLIKQVKFQQHEHFEASEFHIMGWGVLQMK